MFEDEVKVPAGWYPDPMGLPQLRWWNNHAWTELTTDARPPLVMQQPTTTLDYADPDGDRAADADGELPTRRQQREQRERDARYASLATDTDDARDAAASQSPLSNSLREIDPPALVEPPTSTGTIPTNPMPPADDALRLPADPVDSIFMPEKSQTGTHPVETAETTPAAAEASPPAPAGQATQSAQPTPVVAASNSVSIPLAVAPVKHHVYTAAVWIIALVPVMLLITSLLVVVGFGSHLGPIVSGGIWAGSYVLVVILAVIDRISLRRLGYEKPASWAWALLTAPVYLIARSARTSRTGTAGLAPFVVWAAMALLQVASVLVVPGIIIATNPVGFSREAQTSVQEQAAIIGNKITVDCPSTPPVLVGSEFTCAATNAVGKTFDVTVSLQRVNGWIDWRVDDWGVYTYSS